MIINNDFMLASPYDIKNGNTTMKNIFQNSAHKYKYALSLKISRLLYSLLKSTNALCIHYCLNVDNLMKIINSI